MITDYISNKSVKCLQNKLILVFAFLSIWPSIHSYVYHYTSSFISSLLLKHIKFTSINGGITYYIQLPDFFFFVVYSTKLILNLYQQFFLCRPGNTMHNSYYLFQDLELYAWLHKYMHLLASGENCGENKPRIWNTLDTRGKWIDVSCISVALLMSVNICN